MSLLDALLTGPDYEPLARRLRLTDEDAADIRRMYATGSWRQVDLAAEFGVTQPQISKIVNNKQWKSGE